MSDTFMTVAQLEDALGGKFAGEMSQTEAAYSDDDQVLLITQAYCVKCTGAVIVLATGTQISSFIERLQSNYEQLDFENEPEWFNKKGRGLYYCNDEDCDTIVEVDANKRGDQ